MNSSASEVRTVQARKVRLTSEELVVDLVDGRTFAVPVHWYPRLAHGTPAERRNWTLIGQGEGIHWPDLDEDIAVEDLLAGRPSGESQISLQRWLKSRRPSANARMQPSRRKPRVRNHHRNARG